MLTIKKPFECCQTSIIIFILPSIPALSRCVVCVMKHLHEESFEYIEELFPAELRASEPKKGGNAQDL